MSYSYSDNIKSPAQIGASSKGNLTALGDDIDAIEDYIDVLTTGNSKAQTVSPLGDKYFMDTKATCTDASGATQERYVFINNIPDGIIAGEKGLIPGIVEDIIDMDPTSLFTAFSQDNTCQKITMDTRDTNNVEATQSQYVLNSDISDYNPCWFSNNKNPVTSAKCTEGMKVKLRSYGGPKQAYVGPLYWLGVGILAAILVHRALR
jgi:hypothetical protein